MPQSNFFIRNTKAKSSSAKRKKPGLKQGPNKSVKTGKKSKKFQENISSDSELSAHENTYAEDLSSEEETEQEKKLRLTKKYLSQIENEERAKNGLNDTSEAVAQRLKDEALEEAGRLQKKRAHEYENVVPEVLCVLRGHKSSITCLVVSTTEEFVFSSSKDGSIIKWSIEEKKKLKIIPKAKEPGKDFGNCFHSESVLALALSSDDKFLASGCKGKIVNIWDPESMDLLKTFRGHKDEITGLHFQKGVNQLLSASKDRSLKLWDLDEMGYVETLFGHQDSVTGIDGFFGETALTSGGRDSTVRIWKIVEESQLVFQGNGSSIDCVCVSSYQSFVSGGDDGSLFLWSVHKKKPTFQIPEAHGIDSENEQGNWIISLTALQNTDLVASGSKDGFIRLWKRDDDTRSLVLMSELPVIGFVNSMKFSLSGKYLVAGIGQEHRLGRWWRIKESKNSIVIFSWQQKSQ